MNLSKLDKTGWYLQAQKSEFLPIETLPKNQTRMVFLTDGETCQVAMLRSDGNITKMDPDYKAIAWAHPSGMTITQAEC